ncbi:MAG: hypothetical protein H7Z14_09740 [Anaerolineae bacterium]|nr:hypothetical protein [Phycisphaerae bacterium]
MHYSIIRAVPCVVVMLFTTAVSPAAIYQWTGGGPAPKVFNSSANWSSGIVPGVLDRANFNISDTVLFTTSPTNEDSFISGGNFANGITVNMNQSGNQTWSIDTWNVLQKASVVLNGTDVAVEFGTTLSDGGVITVNSGSTYSTGGLSTSPTAPNTFNVTGQVNVNPGGVLAVSGWLQLGAGGPVRSSHGTLNLNGGTVTAGNDVYLGDSGSAGVTGRIAITNSGVMTQTGPGKLYIASQDNVNDSAATLSISGAGSAYVQNAFGAEVGSTLQGAGTLLVTSGGRFQHSSNFNVNKRGSVILSNGGFFLGNMSLKGGFLSFDNSTIDGSVDVSNAGSINATSTYNLFPARRMAVTNGVATFAGGINVSINSTGTITSGSGAIINSAGSSTWGSGANGLAFGSLNGVTNISNLKIGANGGAATINIINGGTLNVSGSGGGGLTIGDNVGTSPAVVKVNGPVGGVVLGQFTPTFINRRGTLQLLGGGFYRGEQLTIDAGTFDGSAGTYTFNATNPFIPSVTVTNGGLFRGADLRLSAGAATVSAGGQVLLTGTFTNGSAINGVVGTTVTGANSLLQASNGFISRTGMKIESGGVASFGTASLQFHPFGGTTLSLNTGGTLNVGSLMDIASNAQMSVLGTGSIAGALTNAGTVTVLTGRLTVDGATTNNGSILFLGVPGGIANFAGVGGAGRFIVSNSSIVGVGHLRQPLVTLSNGARLFTRSNGGPDGVSRVDMLTMDPDGGTAWNLNDNDLIIDYDAGIGSPAESIRAMIATGRNGGAWNGPGLSSGAAREDHRTALGYVDNTLLHYTTFSGQNVNDTCVLVKYTWHGDTDLNGVVDFDDYSRIDAGFSNNRTGWFNGDVDYNGIIDFDDYSLIDMAFNTQSGTLRRALSYLDGGDRSGDGMDSPALKVVEDHFERFGDAYASSFLAAVPEPGLPLYFIVLSSALMRRRTAAR